ncbi:MAG: hypothetical protein O7C59_11690 [Rickettsia endosymbiont of Ixodes persulcatus]|nr:hypothetical protein [Rickettsia endosymbiont of Ixodes persulcatus]MCZ6903815.1 hypothetical protein [Rickettsia endosymbiont of Ixodes persulcatus]MCZ6909559.1 hypothetical protein [Rickettsia endosymbiont of Ixodes persulcatus]MCZ6910490.1 hypothetical protein [Rickettsia endosymbiont of Ixodes persulcatus]MCZ6915014.1 hypothetical protein [Rickettsia endosymbiont of Ixodes persulcatus]
MLDTVVKPRYDTECVFRSMQQRPYAGMTYTSTSLYNTYSYLLNPKPYNFG